MKKQSLFSGLLSLAMLIPIGPALAQNSSNSLAKAELNKSQIQQLKSLGIRVYVPNYIPADFRIAKIDIKPCPSGSQRSEKGVCRFGPQYGIVYRNSNNVCFAIEATGGGVGGPPGLTNQISVNVGSLGESTLYYGQYEMPEMRKRYPESLLYMEWAGTGPFYRLVGAKLVRQAYYKERENQKVSECRNEIDPQEAVKVIESFSRL